MIKKSLSNEQSLRLQLLRFPLIVGVVFIHVYGATLMFSGIATGASEKNHISDFIQSLISQEIARCAVPLFFLISGYLFFHDTQWSTESYVKKIISRTRTLLFPFLFWNILTLLIFFLAQSVPATLSYFSGNKILIANYSFFDYLNAIFGLTRYPISYQFWFIRDLMILALLTPLIHFSLKWLPKTVLGALFVLWFLNIGENSSESAFFFVLGCYFGIYSQSIFLLDQPLSKFLTPTLIIYTLLIIANALFPEAPSYQYMHKTGIILGIPIILYLTRPALALPRLKKMLIALGSTSFFLYAMHEPTLTVFKKISYKLIQPEHNLSIIFIYFFSAIITIITSIVLHKILIKTFPKFTAATTGGR
ncbi:MULTISPECIES: acyltransferase [unclassified Janthinobacterium]|uniref:acyltransferase family protein n=1 Tax=unclassified Janthinobacterium TaxID=2610881 RepID=UPI0027125778|nr:MULTISPECIES: acyltransferase [unclassified Janthinobacterium]MDO8068772.1 acyltransferase [Janthinobacterium sp. SUN206]MDO8073533.1 acyltransferase [Janthinobacterium sp. SUN176]